MSVGGKTTTDIFCCMGYNFFADKTDKLKVLNFIFSDTDLKVYDLGSAYEQEICEYKAADEIASKFDLDNGDKFAVTFQLWSPRHKGKPVFRKIELDPKRCNGYTFRYSTDGWGMIQLHFGGLKNNQLHSSHIGHFNENGALQNESASRFNGKVGDWDWTEIQATSRQLKRHIHSKLAINKIGSSGVLAGAGQLEKSGIILT